MEKMFIYPETLDSRGTSALAFDDTESPRSRGNTASYRCKLYRTLLEQRTASNHTRFGRNNHAGAVDSAHA